MALSHERVRFYRYLDGKGEARMMYATDARSTINLLTVIERLKIKAIGVWHLSSMTPGVRDTITGWRNP